jgi:hypothetical protein
VWNPSSFVYRHGTFEYLGKIMAMSNAERAFSFFNTLKKEEIQVGFWALGLFNEEKLNLFLE